MLRKFLDFINQTISQKGGESLTLSHDTIILCHESEFKIRRPNFCLEQSSAVDYGIKQR